MELTDKIYEDVFSYLNRSKLIELSTVNEEFCAIVEDEFQDKPCAVIARELELHFFADNFDVRIMESENKDMLFQNLYYKEDLAQLFDGILTNPLTRFTSTKLFFNNQLIAAMDLVLKKMRLLYHLWTDQFLSLIFNDIEDNDVRYATLFTTTVFEDKTPSEHKVTTGVGLATSRDFELCLGGSTIRILPAWYKHMIKFEALTLVITYGSADMTLLAEYVESTGARDQSVYLFFANDGTKSKCRELFNLCGDEFDVFLEKLKQDFKTAKESCEFSVTVDFHEPMIVKPFSLYCVDKQEKLHMTFSQVKSADGTTGRCTIERLKADPPSHLSSKRKSGFGEKGNKKKRIQ
ncbi:hypothetical protein Ddc_13773 [Ditylenchus destructor]|nr:hypothetical protein Ddc_13773 [Ditylenchus destructor]